MMDGFLFYRICSIFHFRFSSQDLSDDHLRRNMTDHWVVPKSLLDEECRMDESEKDEAEVIDGRIKVTIIFLDDWRERSAGKARASSRQFFLLIVIIRIRNKDVWEFSGEYMHAHAAIMIREEDDDDVGNIVVVDDAQVSKKTTEWDWHCPRACMYVCMALFLFPSLSLSFILLLFSFSVPVPTLTLARFFTSSKQLFLHIHTT